MSRKFSHNDYTVGWICAIPVELAAAKAVLDETHEELSMQPNDHNSYTLGRVGKHNVVITCLPNGEYGTTSATAVAMQLLSSFHSIRFGLMVGIGGGVPSSHADIRLGDIVVSMPIAGSAEGGVVQYDYGKAISGGHFQRTGMLSRPPQILLTSVSKLRGNHLLEESQVPQFLDEIIAKYPRNSFNFRRPKEEDRLFEATYDHVSLAETCQQCDTRRTVLRPERDDNIPVIHYGRIASGNQVVKDSMVRDRLSQELGVYCVEMEAAGLMNNFPCLVVRGICDYADSHKNKAWQGYAAAAAAAYTKELLLATSVADRKAARTVRQSLSDSEKFRVPLDLSTVPAISDFLGREGDLNNLWEVLRPREAKMRQVAVLHGLGGMGKTQLAIRFSRIHQNDFTAVIWLNGKDQKTLMQSLASAFPRLPGTRDISNPQNNAEVEKQAQEVLDWLSAEGNSKWLLIYDNVDQYVRNGSPDSDGYDVSTFFPRADQGSIVITTRLPEHSELGQSHPVEKLGVDEATKLLNKTSGYNLHDHDISSAAYSDMRAIATRLDGLPLALVIAGVFIRNTGMGFAQYLHYYENSWNRLQSKGEPQRHYFNGNLLATWNISLVEIQKRDPFAVNLLRLLSHFDNRDIWFELLECGLDVDNKPEWVNEMMGDEFSFLKTMKILVSFSFVHVNHENSSYSLHPVIQDWCRHGLTQIEVNDDSNNDKLKEIALVSVGYCVPGTSTKEYWILQQRLLPHANRMVNTIQNGWHIPQNYALINAIGYLGDLYSNQGLLNEAESMYKISLSSKKSFLGENHGSVLNSTQSLAILYVAQGKDNDAEPLFHRVLEGRENSVGSEALATLTAANNLGRFYFDRGEISKAEALFQRALTGFEKTVGPTNKATLLAIYNLAGVFLDQQKWDEAESMYLRSLSGREKLYGPGHPVTLRTVNNLGMLYQRQKRTQEAEKMYRRALEGKEKTLGVNHRVTMRSALLLGKLFREQGRYDEAEVMFRRVLVAYTKTFGQDHVKTTRAAEDLRRTVQMKSREIENAIED